MKSSSVRMFKYFKKAKKYVIMYVIAMILVSLIEIAVPIVEANLVENITTLNTNKIVMFAIIFLIIKMLNLILTKLVYLVYYKGVKKNIILNIRKDMIKNIFDMKLENFDKHSSGEFSERLRTDPESISTLLTVVGTSAFSMMADIVILGYVFYLNYIIGFIYLASIICIYFYQNCSYKTSGNIFEENRDMDDKNTSLLNEVMRGMKDIKLLNISSPVYKLISDNLTSSTDKASEKDLNNYNTYLVVQFLSYLTIFLVLLSGMLLISKNMLSGTSLLIVYMYRTNIFEINLCYSGIKQYLVEYKVASERIFELTNNEEFPKEKFGKTKLTNAKGKIEVRDLSFAYNKKKVIDDMSLKVVPNDTIGIVGPSGSGKSTLLNLLCKGYEVDNGKIFIDNTDINELTKDSIRNNISIINQEPYIFDLTIKENLELVGSNIKKSEIIEACKIAQIHDYIMTLPDKYDTLIGENGTSLSGGQKQRLAIARALLKKSKIILFDEATSALDNVTQTELQKSLNNLSNNYTMIIVAHRLSTIKDCKKIYVFDKGQIVGSGTHQELLASNKIYKKLYQNELK